jgi:hypothetical protein
MSRTIRLRTLWGVIAGALLLLGSVYLVSTWRADAAGPGLNESTFVPVTPIRILDTRDPTNLGLAGPFVSLVPLDLKVTGSIPTSAGTQVVVPAGATAVTLNLTTVNSQANGFVSIRPANATGPPQTSSLNFEAGKVVANTVTVALPTQAGANNGKIEIAYNANGVEGKTTNLLIDVAGYYLNGGLQELIPYSDIVMTYGPTGVVPQVTQPAVITYWSAWTSVDTQGHVSIPLDGPLTVSGRPYRMITVTVCLGQLTSPGLYLDYTWLTVGVPGYYVIAETTTNRSAEGCYTLSVTNDPSPPGSSGYTLILRIAGDDSGALRLAGFQATWSPVPL